MYKNSLSLTNTQDGIFNTLYVIGDNGVLENVKDIMSTAEGPKGDTGERGLQGVKGDTGLQGTQGLTGPKGTQVFKDSKVIQDFKG